MAPAAARFCCMPCSSPGGGRGSPDQQPGSPPADVMQYQRVLIIIQGFNTEAAFLPLPLPSFLPSLLPPSSLFLLPSFLLPSLLPPSLLSPSFLHKAYMYMYMYVFHTHICTCTCTTVLGWVKVCHNYWAGESLHGSLV